LTVRYLIEPSPNGDTSESGSDEEIEFVKTEGDDDRRKALLDSVQTGDQSLDHLKKQNSLEDYAGFFHPPDNPGEDGPSTARDQQRADSTKTPPVVGSDRSGGPIATTSSGPGGGCIVQQTITSTSVTGNADSPTDGAWACPICTL